VAYKHNGELFSHKEEWNYVICRKIDESGNNLVKWNKPEWERQILHVLSHIWNLDLNKNTSVKQGLGLGTSMGGDERRG
jgi:hypothetical protein